MTKLHLEDYSKGKVKKIPANLKINNHTAKANKKVLTGSKKSAKISKVKFLGLKPGRRNKKMEKLKSKANKANQEIQSFIAFVFIVVAITYSGYVYFDSGLVGTVMSAVLAMVAVSKLKV